jgi:YaiO family outer membrane protein
VATVALALGTAGASAQTLRVAGWGTYEGVTASADWSTAGAQFTFATGRGDAAWAAAEHVARFGETDAVARIGGVLHPTARWWITGEVAIAARPQFMPRNSWDVDVTARVARGASLGLGYGRRNYVVGPVDLFVPHVGVETRRVAWDLRVFLSRNPSHRVDAAFYLRATATLSRRAFWWVLGGAGRESYLVGTAPAQVRSLETVTGATGVRYHAGHGFTVRIDASVVGSRPVLSRRAMGVGVEKQF